MIEEEMKPVQVYDEVPGEGVAVPFRFDEPRWLKVEFLAADGGVVLTLDHDPDGTEVAQQEGSFIVRYPEEGGEALPPRVVTLPALPEGRRLRISRVTPLEQPLELAPNAPLPARALERALDRLTMALQDQQAENGTMVRSVLTFPPGEPAGFRTQLPTASGRAGKLLGFHRVTGEMELVTTTGIAVNAANAQLQDLRSQVEALHLQAAAGFQNAAEAEADDFFYRHGNDGLKFGEIGNTDLMDDPDHTPGAESMTIQPGTDTPMHRAKGWRSIAIGYGTHAEAAHGVSIGSLSQTWGGSAVSLGHDAVARGSEAVAVGRSAYAELDGSVAVGPWARTPVQTGVTGYQCVAVGFMTEAGGAGGTAVGMEARATGGSSLAVGTGAVAAGDGQTSVGHGAGSESHPADRALSLGAFSRAKAAESCAVGIRCTAEGAGGTAVGVDAGAHGARSTAVGWYTSVAAPDGCAFGYQNMVAAEAARSTALGHGVTLEVPDSVDVRAGGESPRLFLSGRTGAVHLSYLLTDRTPAASANPWGEEPEPDPELFHIPQRMLAFRVNSAKTHLYIDVAVEEPGGPVIRTVSLPFD
ncbi:hypothetical protein OVA24_17005 [Luteolibacter sp. SL250]|uniref:hypothetical protein n=1 Tax=Luteolibacter sp. SL250 TaxID=2995170 RepID=UPI00227026FC|nr:hypothetical protein [Luteolibacter sp. SL250]WAC18933.1 hypothetical protein OVA24_17005 [Luteolibacter sp. SL250]